MAIANGVYAGQVSTGQLLVITLAGTRESAAWTRYSTTVPESKCCRMTIGHVVLAVITGTTIVVLYHLVQVWETAWFKIVFWEMSMDYNVMAWKLLVLFCGKLKDTMNQITQLQVRNDIINRTDNAELWLCFVSLIYRMNQLTTLQTSWINFDPSMDK